MSTSFSKQVWESLREWWRQRSRENGALTSSWFLLRALWGFMRDSTPEQRRSRYGDMDYDWEHRVNTTSGTVGWHERLLGIFHSPYQPTDPSAFREMMATLPIDYSQFVFIDLGSGKGRTLLMASDYPFRKVVGVELLPELHRAAERNVADYRNRVQHSIPTETFHMDAEDFVFPDEPTVLYLFNPLPEEGLRSVISNLETSVEKASRPIWIIYHNPQMERLLMESKILIKVTGKPAFSIFRTR